ncbi:TIGR03085 family metal-binding protein [Georgenia sp. TF02-10]|uniref:TIGR03085 family metal-binding protein n=1 Tax=Georgenia sp. TF02-10 TaxID=2917725 RepID=UPI001FA7E772|nr:TIGR03085 family metal-binding protein [Georgenia sp. TF02-10]UNX56152.1 TIGR03085 family metal-binding protein [Georgenia sp. TF02-10]
MPWMETERAALVQTLREADPDAATMCEGWTVRHVLGHLVLREQRPYLVLPDMLARRPPGQEPFLGRLVAGARTPAGYQALVDRFAGGPPAWSPVGWLGDTGNLIEYVVHHEDVRRGGAEPAEPRVLPPDMVRAVWARLLPTARLSYRTSPVGVVLVVPGGPRRVVHRGADAVVVVGDPVELALHALGRTHAEVDVHGRSAVVDRFLASR